MADEDKKKSGALGNLVQAESMMQLALAVPGGCLIGWLLGALAAKHFHQEWMTVAGVVLGAVAGFVQIFRMASSYLKRDS